MITHIHIQNFRSFIDAEVTLQPFSLVVGANGSGKTNLLRGICTIFGTSPADRGTHPRNPNSWERHANQKGHRASFEFRDSAGQKSTSEHRGGHWHPAGTGNVAKDVYATLFSLIADDISGKEQISPNGRVGPSGKGTTQVLDMLKNGDREDLFDAIESNFKSYVPEVEKLSLRTVTDGIKQIQVREVGLNDPLPANQLSEGTRIILAILTIIHQENPPGFVLLEDIDRGLHPRLFEYLTPLMRDIAKRHSINIIATTHNPYLVDAFQDDKEAVIIVEKKDGVSTLSTLAQRLEGLDYDSVDPDDMPLGQLWFSGLVGGTPKAISTRVP